MAKLDYSTEGVGFGNIASGIGQVFEREDIKKQREKELQDKQKAQQEQMKQEQQYRIEFEQMRHQMNLLAEQTALANEIEKMKMRSTLDFERVEKARQLRLESIDNKIMQLNKEKDEGRFSEDEPAYANILAYWQSQKDAIETGVKAPTFSGIQHPLLADTPMAREARKIAEEKAQVSVFGKRPYWMEFLGEQYAGTQLGQMAGAILEGKVSGVKAGTVPWFLSPEFINTRAGIAAQENEGIFLEDVERQAMYQAGKQSGQIPEMPAPTTKQEYDALPRGTRYIAPDGSTRTKQ